MAPRRPTAFEISFPDELVPGDAKTIRSPENQKRKADAPIGALREEKRLRDEGGHLVPLALRHYHPHEDDIPESQDTLLEGEDPDELEDDKPIRILADFVVFDSKHDMTLISLELLGKKDGIERQFEAAGLASVAVVNEQDEEEIDNAGLRLRLSDVVGFTMDYTKFGDPFYIETPHAWYMAESPSNAYRPYFQKFVQNHKIAQFVIASAVSSPSRSAEDFLDLFLATWDDLLERNYTEDDLRTAVPATMTAVESLKDATARRILATPILCHLLDKHAPAVAYEAIEAQPRWEGNIDSAVLQPQNQNSTHVTPRIAALSSGLFRERLTVIGPPPARQDKKRLKAQEEEARRRLRELLSKVSEKRRVVRLGRDRRQKKGVLQHPGIIIDGEEYSVGDVVIVPAGHDGDKPPPLFPAAVDDIPVNAKLADYFWFAKIMHFYDDRDLIHVQWFHHSSKTVMGEIADPQELFFTDICDDISLYAMISKANVQYLAPGAPLTIGIHDYFFKFMYNAAEASFRDIDVPLTQEAGAPQRLSDCPACQKEQQRNFDFTATRVAHGITYLGFRFHIYDFVLIRAVNGPCLIGHIVDIRVPSDNSHRRAQQISIKVRLLGRITDVMDIAPRHVIKDERHLFFTDETGEFTLDDLIRPCFVLHKDSIPDLTAWVSCSPDHFFVQYKFLNSGWAIIFPSLLTKDVKVCAPCVSQELADLKASRNFLATMEKACLRAFDPFAGVGAFGSGMEQSGCIKITHAIEISPSAAETLHRNSPETKVYNQCSNKILQYAIKTKEGHRFKPPVSIDKSEPLPAPPKPDDIDCIVAGFPCQPHSRLNMFQRADDRKSNLILNLLSWVDFLQPKYCFLENVRGFMSFNLMSHQQSKHTVTGGIEAGGLKFVIRALIAMDYQVRFALLQAGHYGSPQSRVRFFLVAALRGHPLPSLPQPTHDFPVVDGLEIKLPNGESIRPVRTLRGTAPRRFVTVDDAIGDLPRFDWKNPNLSKEPRAERIEARKRESTIPSIKCDQSRPNVGPDLRGRNVRYHHDARTSYQVWCRQRRTEDLQHFTRVLKPIVVERVVKVPLVAKADYRMLPEHLQEWQAINPYSANARHGFRPGLYGRIDKDGYFSTTVTNMEPTAKQSWVLNPYCKRVVTVRELARSQGFPDWFTFYALDDSVKTMHRQIGNAVPWPVSMALGRELRNVLFEMWKKETKEEGDAIVVDSD